MREILFRGKRKDNGEWAYGSLLVHKGFSIFDSMEKNFVTVDSKTVSQYTGLKDKNSKKIFEGDILSVGKKRIELIYVTFSDFRWDCLSKKHQYFRHTLEDDPGKYEVVGNIYDNPELLGGE